MVKDFEEYHNLLESDFNILWQDSLIVLDTNVLLNFYRYSTPTVNDFFDVLKFFSSRIWIPFQVASEFHIRRLDIIQAQIKVYADSIKENNLILQSYSDKRKSPFLSINLHDKFLRVLDEVNQELQKNLQDFELKLYNDDILLQITDLFINNTGLDYDSQKKHDIYKLGAERYLNRIPPGFCDGDVKKDENKFGDLLIWFQILDKAKEINKPIIFVTDDKKEDWWLRKNGKTLGARPELRREFRITTKQPLFHMYTPFNFIEHTQTLISLQLKNTTLNEVQELDAHKSSTKANTILIISRLELSYDHSLKSFINSIDSYGYDVTVVDIDVSIVELRIILPNISDLPRRIQSKFFTNLDIFGLKLIEFKEVSLIES